MLLHHAFEAAQRRLPDKLALVDGARRVTYRELGAMSCALAGALHEAGVARGDRVLVFLENTVEYAAAVHAVLMADAVFVPVNPLAKTERLSFIAADTRASALLTHASLASVWAVAIERVPALRSIIVAGKVAADREKRVRAWPQAEELAKRPTNGVTEQDLAALIYTSGTTGKPKGVMLTHRNMCSAWNSVQSYLGLREDDVIALALPPAFSYGLYNLLMGLGLGATVVLERQAVFPIRMAETLQRERATVFPAVPTLFASLIGVPHLERFDFASVRILTNAAAALPTSFIARLRAAFPEAQLFSMYGMTECKRISYLPPEELERRPASVGRGMPGQELWLVDEDGRRLPWGASGELVVRGAHVMRGYWERPAETEERLRLGAVDSERVLHTGDLFRSEADGYLYFIARKDDIIKTRGEKVAPREVEDIIHQLDDVTGCAVVGVADETLGEAIKAYVTLREGSGLTPRDIVRHCLAHLESYMAPKFVEVVDELPRTESGKIRHASLRGS